MDSVPESGTDSVEQSAESTATSEATPNKHQELIDIIEAGDKRTLNPEQRALKFWEILKESPRFKELSTWDIVCFAGAGVAMFHTFHPWLEEQAKTLAQMTHTIHYANIDAIVQQEKDANLNQPKV